MRASVMLLTPVALLGRRARAADGLAAVELAAQGASLLAAATLVTSAPHR